MPRLQVQVPEEVDRVLTRHAKALWLARQQFIRAILCAVARELDHEQSRWATDGGKAQDGRAS